MQVQRGLAAVEHGVGLGVLENTVLGGIGRVGRAGAVEQAAGEDVVVDAVEEGVYPHAHPRPGVAQAPVELQVGFRVEGVVAQLVAGGALVVAVGGQLGDVGGPEATGRVGFEHQLLGQVKGRPQAAGQVAVAAAEAPEFLVGGGAGGCRAGRGLAVEEQAVGGEVAAVEAQAAAQIELAQGFAGHGVEAAVEQAVGGNQVFLAGNAVLLLHAAQAHRGVPAVFLGQVVARGVVEGAQLKVQGRLAQLELAGLAGLAVGKLAALVQLPAHVHGQPAAVGQHKTVVEPDAVVLHQLARGEQAAVAAQVVGGGRGAHQRRPIARHALKELARQRVAHALHDTELLVEGGEGEVGVAPAFIQTHVAVYVPLAIAGVLHLAIVAVFVVAGQFARGPRHPVEAAAAVAAVGERGANQVVVRLIVGHHRRHGAAHGHGFRRAEVHHAAQPVGAVEQAAGAFHNLGPAHRILVGFHALQVVPLLAFLAGAVVELNHPAAGKPPDDDLADGRPRRELSHARRAGQRVHGVGGGLGVEGSLLHRRRGQRRAPGFRRARHPRNHHLAQLGGGGAQGYFHGRAFGRVHRAGGGAVAQAVDFQQKPSFGQVS